MERTPASTSSTDAPVRVPVGRVVGAHGLRGQLRVVPLGEGAELLRPGARVRVCGQGGEPAAEPFEITAASPGRRGELRVALAGVRRRESAEALRGALLEAPSEELAELPEGEYYAYQLVGCSVEDEAGRPLGRVSAIWETGAPDVLVLEHEGGERLVPAALVRRVELDARRVVIELLPGLLEDG